MNIGRRNKRLDETGRSPREAKFTVSNVCFSPYKSALELQKGIRIELMYRILTNEDRCCQRSLFFGNKLKK